MKVIAEHMRSQDIGTCGPSLGSLGVAIFRGKIIRLGEAPLVEPALHLYSLGCRSWGLHGMEQKMLAKPENHPAIRRKIAELQSETSRLEKDKPTGWLDRRRRYQHAVAGLKQILQGNM